MPRTEHDAVAESHDYPSSFGDVVFQDRGGIRVTTSGIFILAISICSVQAYVY